MAELTPGAAAPEVPVTTAPGAEQQPVTPPTSPAGTEPGDKPVQSRTYTEDEHKALVDQRVRERLTKERRRIEREARATAEATFYRELAEKGLHAPQRSEPEKPKGRPQAKDFQTVEEFLDADYSWRREQEREAEAKQRQEREPKERAAKSAEEFSQSLQDKLADDGSGKYRDFDDVVFSEDVPFTDPMVAAIHESAHPRDLAYHLATNPNELRRIAKLPPTRQVIELGKIEDKLAAPPEPTKAPPPIVPNAGNSSTKKDWTQMGTEEHVKAWLSRPKR